MQSGTDNKKIEFKYLEKKDIDLIIEWLKNKHVREFWVEDGTQDEVYKTYEDKINSDNVFPFIIQVDSKPIGYIQYYLPTKIKNRNVKDLTGIKDCYVDDETIGFDIYIGESSCIGKGMGQRILKEFVKLLFNNPKFKKVICDPMVKNERAIHCYQKVGFKPLTEFNNSEGRLLLMRLDKNSFIRDCAKA